MRNKGIHKYSLLLLLILFTQPLKAQAPDCLFAKGFGGALEDYGTNILTDKFGNSYITGSFFGPYDFNGTVLQTAGYYDCYLAKLDSNGNFLWAKSYGNTGFEGGFNLAMDAASNLYIIGLFEDSLVLGSTQLFSNTFRNIFFAKLDQTGNPIWAKSIENSVSIGNELGIAVDPDNNIYVSGNFRDSIFLGNITLTSHGEYDGFIAKLDSLGNYLLAKTIGGIGYDYSTSVSLNHLGEIYVSGQFKDTVIFGADSLVNNGLYGSVFITKLDQNANHLWTNAIGDLGNFYFGAFALDANGNCYLTMPYKDSILIDGTTYQSNGFSDILLVKIDLNGNIDWVRSYGGFQYDWVDGITSDAFGNCYITGGFRDTSQFGFTTLISKGYDDIFVSKIDPNGNFIWARSFGSIGQDAGQGIGIDSSGNSFICGSFHFTMEIDDFTLNAVPTNWDAFIVKLGNKPSEIPNNELKEPGAIIFPNPLIQKEITVVFYEEGDLSIYNIHGKQILHQDNIIGRKQLHLDLSSGLYLARFETRSGITSQKLIVE